jgi:hypothetical protein
MNPDYSRMMATAAQAYAACVVATLEVGGRALRATAAESGDVAALTAAALRAPAAYRATATEEALFRAHDAQRRLLHGIGGLPTLWGMAFLNRFDRRAAGLRLADDSTEDLDSDVQHPP